MKQLILIIGCFLLLGSTVGCWQYDRSKVIEQYKFEDNSNILNVNINKELEPWVKKGIKCYGIVMVCDLTGNPIRIREVQAKIIDILPMSIKMVTLEDLIINRKIECRKASFKKGECWNEENGEIFQTKTEAIRYIDSKYPGLRLN